MRIGIDARLLAYRRGMGNFLYNLLIELIELDRTNQYVLYTNQPLSDTNLDLPDNFQVQFLSLPTYPLWEQVALPLAARRDQLDVLHCPANTGPLWLPKGVSLVLTVHDVMYMLPTSVLPASPSLYQRLGRLYRRLVVPLVARRATTIVTDSHYSRQDIVKYLDGAEDSVQVVWGAPNSACRVITDATALTKVRTKYALHRPFILALAGVDPRKNTVKVIEAFALLLKNFSAQPAAYQLALVGLPTSAQPSFLTQARKLGVDRHVSLMGFVPEADLVALYNLAEVFVYPSLYEGFGLPVLEAMACGTPVVTSPAGSIPEVAGDAALFVDPTSAVAISQGIIQVLSDRELAQRLQALGFAQAGRFSWRRTATEMLRIYADAATPYESVTRS